jgi:hypothetical protein
LRLLRRALERIARELEIAELGVRYPAQRLASAPGARPTIESARNASPVARARAAPAFAPSMSLVARGTRRAYLLPNPIDRVMSSFMISFVPP